MAHELDGGGAILGQPDDVQLGVSGQERAQAFAHELVVVRQDDAEGHRNLPEKERERGT